MSAELLRDLARVKVIFQLRAIEAVIRGSDNDRSGEAGATTGATCGESVGRRHRPNHG